MDVGSLTARLSLDTSKFTDSIKSVTRSVEAVTSAVNSIGSSGTASFNEMRNAMDGLAYSAKGAGKEISRITQGIIFSQMFYKSVNAVKGAVGAVFNLSKEAEMAAGSFMVMLKSEEQAIALVEHLKNFAAETQFDFTTASDAAKQLLAYGFQLQDLERLMGAIGDASAAMGDAQAFNRIAIALGQIRTKGRLATQEILQLTEVGIPAYEILEKQLGLTKAQLDDIGRMGVSSTVAIEALLRGIEQNYGGAMELLADTVDGYINNIKESFTAMMSEIFEPFYYNLKEMLRRFSRTLDDMRKIVAESGVGGLINSIFSEQAAAVMRQLFGAFKILGESIKNLASSMAPFAREIAIIASTILGVVIPAIAFFLNIMSSLLQIVSANTVVMNAFRIVVAGLVILKSITVLVKSLATVFSLLTSPVMLIVAGLTALIALFATLAGQGSKVVGVINGIGQAINNLYGIKNEDVLPPDIKDPPDFDKIVSGLEDTNDALEETEEKAKKAAKSLMSFDEVFTLTEKSADKGALADFAFPDLDMGNPLEGFGLGFDTSGAESSLATVTDAVQNMVNKIKGFLGGNGLFKGIHKLIDSVADSLVDMTTNLMTYLKSVFGPSWDLFWDGMELTVVSWINGLREILHGVVDIFEGVIEMVAGVVTSDWQRAWEGLYKVMEGLGSVTKGAITIVQGTLQGLLTWLKGVFGPGWTSTFDMLIDVVGSMGDNLKLMTDNMVNIFYGFIEIVMSVVLNDWELFWDGFYRVTDNAKELFGNAIQAIRETIEALVVWLKDIFGPSWDFVWEGAGEVLQGALTVISGVIDGIIDIFEGLIEFVIGVFTGDWDMAWKGITNVIKGFSKATDTILAGLQEMFKGLITWLKGIFGPEWDSLWDGAERVFNGVCIAIKGLVDGLLQVLYGIIEFLVGIFTGDWEMVWSGIQNVVDGVVLAIVGILDGIVEALRGLIDWIGSWFGPNWEAAWEAIGEILDAFNTIVKGIIDGLVSVFKGLIEFIIGVFTGDWSRAWNGIKTIFEGFGKALRGIVDGLVQILVALVTWIATTLSNLWTSAWNGIKNNFSIVIDGIKTIAGGLKTAFKGIIDFIVGVFTGDWGRAWMGVQNVFKGIFDGLVGIVKTPLNFIIELINKAIEGINGMIGTVNKVPGVDVPKVGKIPKLAKGGLVTKHTLAEIGEGNKQEAVIPLESGHATDKIASRILEGMQDIIKPNTDGPAPHMGGGGDAAQTVLYVGTLIADDRSLKELERKMKVIRLEEEGRRG